MNKIIKWGLIGLGNASLNLAKEFNKIDNNPNFFNDINFWL